MFEIYDVKEGDCLSDIALKFESTDDELCRINGFSDDVILSKDMKVIVPVVDKSPYLYYTVKKDENIYDISKKYDVDYEIILMLNGFDGNDYIYPNQTIMIPKKGIGTYFTGDNDTLIDVINYLNVDVDELIKQNDNIYLKPEQIIFFKKK